MKGAKQVTLDESKHLIELLQTNLITRRGVAVDGGAHVGAWTVVMTEAFESVYAFEPHPKAFEYLVENCGHLPNVHLRNAALMDRSCGIDVYAPGRTTLTATQVRYNDESLDTAVTIDQYDLEGCDFLKLDIEGAELMALKGAEETIKRFRPFVLVELNNMGGRFGVKDKDVRKWLINLGYAEVWARGVDAGFSYVG